MRKSSFVRRPSLFVRTTNYEPRTTNYQPRTTRGQGLPISTIIIAIIGLLVLIIMGVLITQKVGVFGKGAREQTDQKCEGAVGTPASIGECQNPVYGTFTNLRADQICCK